MCNQFISVYNYSWAPMESHTCAGNHRKLKLTAQPNLTLTVEHVPPHCRRAKTLLLGPLTPSDLDAAAFVHQQHGMRLQCITCTMTAASNHAGRQQSSSRQLFAVLPCGMASSSCLERVATRTCWWRCTHLLPSWHQHGYIL